MEQTTTVFLTLLFLLSFALFYALGYTEISFNCRLYPNEIKKAIIILKGLSIAQQLQVLSTAEIIWTLCLNLPWIRSLCSQFTCTSVRFCTKLGCLTKDFFPQKRAIGFWNRTCKWALNVYIPMGEKSRREVKLCPHTISPFQRWVATRRWVGKDLATTRRCDGSRSTTLENVRKKLKSGKPTSKKFRSFSAPRQWT